MRHTSQNRYSQIKLYQSTQMLVDTNKLLYLNLATTGAHVEMDIDASQCSEYARQYLTNALPILIGNSLADNTTATTESISLFAGLHIFTVARP